MATGIRRRPQKPLYKPFFDEHFTPISKVPAANELPSQLIVRELSEADSDFDSTPEPTTLIHHPSRPPPPSPIPLIPTKARSTLTQT